jgi:hypothetical protein
VETLAQPDLQRRQGHLEPGFHKRPPHRLQHIVKLLALGDVLGEG